MAMNPHQVPGTPLDGVNEVTAGSKQILCGGVSIKSSIGSLRSGGVRLTGVVH